MNAPNPKPRTTPPPKGLGPTGKALWTSIVGWEQDGVPLELRPDELALLGLAAATADVIYQLEQDVVGEPRVRVTASGDDRVDPLIVELRLQRAELARHLARLNIPEPDSDGAWDHLTAAQRARKAARARWSG